MAVNAFDGDIVVKEGGGPIAPKMLLFTDRQRTRQQWAKGIRLLPTAQSRVTS
jgi:hypothetical protein